MDIPDTYADWHAFAPEPDRAANVADEVLISSLIIQHDGIRAAGNTAQQQLESHGMTGHCNSYPNPVSASQRRANQQQNQQRRRQHPDQQHFASAGSQGQQNSAADAALMTHGAYFAVDLIGDDVKGAILDECLLMNPDMEIKLEEDCNTHGGDSNDGWWLQPQSTDHRRQLCDIHRVDNRSSISALPGSAQQLPICSQTYKHNSVSLADLTEGASIDSSVNAEGNTTTYTHRMHILVFHPNGYHYLSSIYVSVRATQFGLLSVFSKLC
jgi:hypothetical protein